jgi:hypothetical protein
MKPRSNEREMIYLTASYLGDEDSLGQLLSHELQHMIHWNQDISEALWVNEGLSLLAEEVNGYGYVLGRRQFSNNPDIQLTNWAEDPQDRYRNYAASKLFLSYLSEHHGGHEHLALLVSDPADGVAGVENVLASTSSRSSSFDAVFADWAVANLLHDSSVADGRFSYALHTGWDPETTASLSASEAYTGWVRQYGVDYVEIKGAGATLTVTGSGLASLTSATPASGEFAWWSYRRNMLDSRLTRQVDLTSVDQATLRFSTWYDIEGDFDYGYVAVSLDEGQSWQTLTGTHTTSSDPNAANYGRGYTGRSARWLQETIDLSSFCGQHVLLRFWYITDPGLNRPGWLIDDIAIPEIGFRDDAETPADGWTAEGFVRSANDVPQTYQVLLVEFRDDGAHVRSLTMQDSLGSVTLSEAAPRAVLLVAGTARWTSELAPYKVEVAP